MSKTNILILSSWSLESTIGNRNETINQPNMVEKCFLLKSGSQGKRAFLW